MEKLAQTLKNLLQVLLWGGGVAMILYVIVAVTRQMMR